MAKFKNVVGCKLTDSQKTELSKIIEGLETNTSEFLRSLIDSMIASKNNFQNFKTIQK